MELKDRVHKRMNDELEARLEEVAKLKLKEIIDRAYEITVKQELVMLMQNDVIDERTLEMIDKLERPLSSIYTEWLCNDYLMLDELKVTINEMAEQLRKQLDDGMGI